MGKIEYDFREGLDGTKRVYSDKRSCNCGEFWAYAGWLIGTWIYAAGFFALFLWAWLKDRYITFWVFVGVWFSFMFFLIFGFFLPNLLKFYADERKTEKKELEEKIAKERLLESYVSEMKGERKESIKEEKKVVEKVEEKKEEQVKIAEENKESDKLKQSNDDQNVGKDLEMKDINVDIENPEAKA